MFGLKGCLTNSQHSPARVLLSCPYPRTDYPASNHGYPVPDPLMRITSLVLLSLSVLVATPARADLHITRDHGGYVEEYKAKYKRIRDRKERVIIDGICNSACTVVFRIVPLNRIFLTPQRSHAFHPA